MVYNLLEIVQLLLASLESDEVNDINETQESRQLALMLKSVFYDCAVELNLPEHNKTFELNASGNLTKPVLMTLPDNVVRIDWIKYDTKADADTTPNYQEVKYVDFSNFIEYTQSYRNDPDNIGTMSWTSNGETHEVVYRTDVAPSYYTVVEDNTLIFDAYEVVKENTLQKSKTLCQGMIYPTFTLSNTFKPALNPAQFSYFINRAKVRAFAEFKQATNNEAAGEARNQKILQQKRKHRTPGTPEILTLKTRYGRR